jgi:epsin
MIKARIGDMYSRLAAVLLMKDPNSNIPQSLTVLYYLLHTGSGDFFLYFCDNLYIINTLKKFQYVDEDGNDNGANVRQKAEDVYNFLNDPADVRRKVLEAIWKEFVEKQSRIPEEIDLAAAIRLSEDEKAKRHEAVEAATLFDDQAQM